MADEKNNKAIRCFIAAQLEDDILEQIKSFQQTRQQEKWAKSVRWIKQENLHITLRFLGNIDLKQLASIEQVFVEFRQNQRFEIQCSSPQAFPNLRKARVLAAVIHKNPQLIQLAQKAEVMARYIGLAEETRPFRGHITIGRFSSPGKGLEVLLKQNEIWNSSIKSLILYQSILGKSGAIYRNLQQIELQTEKKYLIE